MGGGLVGGRNIVGLTSLRFFAAFLVFGYHGNVLLTGPAREVGHILFGGGQSGVTFFFVLSGFLLTWVAKPNDTAGRFYRRRFARIYPAYLVTLFAGGALTALSNPSALRNGILTPFLLQSWVPDQSVIQAINIPAWSLSCEAFFYAVFPLLLPLLIRLSPLARRVALASAVTVVVLVAAAAAVIQAAQGDSFLATWIVGFLPLTRLPEFLAGVLLALVIQTTRLPRVPLAGAAVLAYGTVLLSGLVDAAFALAAIPIVPFMILIVGVVQAESAAHARPTVLTSSVLETLGKWSFSFYLVHVLCMSVVHTAARTLGIDELADGLPVWFMLLAGSTAAAWALHRLVEVPCDRLLRGSRAAAPVDM